MIAIVHGDTRERIIFYVHCQFLLSEVFMPNLQDIGASRDVLNTERAVFSANGMEGMIVHAEKGLHPAMNVAFNDHIAGTLHGLNQLGLMRSQSLVQVGKSVPVNRMKDGVTIDGFNTAFGCYNCHVGLKLAIAVIQRKGNGLGAVILGQRHVVQGYDHVLDALISAGDDDISKRLNGPAIFRIGRVLPPSGAWNGGTLKQDLPFKDTLCIKSRR